MNPNRIYFDAIKEHRGQYFVEYHPPNFGARFAILYLVFLNPIDKKKVAELMEAELNRWLKRYAVPIMVSAFDEKDTPICLMEEKGFDFLFGFLDSNTNVLRYWRQVKDEELPADALDTNYLRRVYVDIPYKTGEQIQQDIKKRNRSIRTGWFIVSGWTAIAAIIPILILILGQTNRLIEIIAFAYSLYRAVNKAYKLIGKKKPSPKEIERIEKERKMEHYYYHCEQNQEGFRRLMIENFEKDAKEDIQKEAEMLKLTQTNTQTQQ
jgi:Sec-independent protein translocase protein TatA